MVMGSGRGTGNGSRAVGSGGIRRPERSVWMKKKTPDLATGGGCRAELPWTSGPRSLLDQQPPANQALRKSKMSFTSGAVVPSPPKSAKVLEANQSLRKAKMSATWMPSTLS